MLRAWPHLLAPGLSPVKKKLKTMRFSFSGFPGGPGTMQVRAA